jgi:hypothetical protein
MFSIDRFSTLASAGTSKAMSTVAVWPAASVEDRLGLDAVLAGPRGGEQHRHVVRLGAGVLHRDGQLVGLVALRVADGELVRGVRLGGGHGQLDRLEGDGVAGARRAVGGGLLRVLRRLRLLGRGVLGLAAGRRVAGRLLRRLLGGLLLRGLRRRVRALVVARAGREAQGQGAGRQAGHRQHPAPVGGAGGHTRSAHSDLLHPSGTSGPCEPSGSVVNRSTDPLVDRRGQ